MVGLTVSSWNMRTHVVHVHVVSLIANVVEGTLQTQCDLVHTVLPVQFQRPIYMNDMYEYPTVGESVSLTTMLSYTDMLGHKIPN